MHRKGGWRKENSGGVSGGGACSMSEVGSYVEDYKHLLESTSACGIKDIDVEMSITGTGAKRVAEQARHGRGQPLHPNPAFKPAVSDPRF